MQVEQYQNFSISYEGEDFSVPGEKAAGENIADNGGMKAAYEAYKRLPDAEKQCVPGFNFTSDQLFWVKYFDMRFIKLYQISTDWLLKILVPIGQYT